MRLSPSRHRLVYVIAIGTWLSGMLWLLFHHFLMRNGEFGLTPNPLEPWWLRLHAAFAFAAMWLFGLLWGIHITRGWPHKRHRNSGALLVGCFIWLIVTGFLLYYAGSDHARSIVSQLHWVLGAFAPLALLTHRIGSYRRHRQLRRHTRRRAAHQAHHSSH